MHPEPELTPAFIDAVARRVLDLAARKLTVGDVAEIYGVHPTWVYARADQLGAFRLGSGPKAPLRFDPDKVDAAFEALADGTATAKQATFKPSLPAAPRRRRRRRDAAHQIELLPISGSSDRAHERPGPSARSHDNRRTARRPR